MIVIDCPPHLSLSLVQSLPLKPVEHWVHRGLLTNGSLLLPNITQVAAGRIHSAALTANNVLFTWGAGESGQLAHQQVTTPTPANAAAAAAAPGAATEAAALAGVGEPSASAAGATAEGGVALATPAPDTCAPSPRPVAGLPHNAPILYIAAGGDHCFAVVEEAQPLLGEPLAAPLAAAPFAAAPAMPLAATPPAEPIAAPAVMPPVHLPAPHGAAPAPLAAPAAMQALGKSGGLPNGYVVGPVAERKHGRALLPMQVSLFTGSRQGVVL